MEDAGAPAMQQAADELDRSYAEILEGRRARADARRRGFRRRRGPSDDLRDIAPRPYDPQPDESVDVMRAQLTAIAEHELAPMLRELGDRMDRAARASWSVRSSDCGRPAACTTTARTTASPADGLAGASAAGRRDRDIR